MSPSSNATIAISPISSVALRTSTVLNVADGQRSGGGNQHRRYAIAHGSANEVKAALDIAEVWGYVADTSAPRATGFCRVP